MEAADKKRVVAATVGVLAIAGATGLGWHVLKPATKHAVRGTPAVASVATAARVERALAPAQGAVTAAAELDYSVEFQSNVRIGQAAGSRVHGSFSMLLVEHEAQQGNVVVSGTVRDAAVVVEEGDEATREAVENGMGRDLQQSFALMLDPRGKVTRFGSGATLSAATESVLRAAASALQYDSGPGGGAKDWRGQETDHYGAFIASYRMQSVDRIDKLKQYTTLALPALFGGADATKASAKGRASYQLAPQGHWPVRVDMTDELDTGPLKVEQRFTLSLQSVRAVKRGPADLRTIRLSALDRVVERSGAPTQGVEYAKRLVNGASYRDLVGELSKLSDSDEDTGKRHQLIRRLSALFELDPAAATTAARALRDQTAGDQATALMGALTSSQSSEARTALNQMASDKALPAQLRSDALANMTVQAKATGETFSTLNTLLKDEDPKLRNGAVLALGSTARSTEADPALAREAERANRTLHQGYQTAQSPAERAMYLKGLGNSGSSQTLQAAKDALASPDPSLRREGVRALRLVQGEEADLLISQAWQRDEDASVREMGPFAANYRPLTPVLAQAALTSVSGDENEVVRLRSLAFIADNMRENPLFLEAIKKVAKDDPSAELRQAAQRYLGSS